MTQKDYDMIADVIAYAIEECTDVLQAAAIEAVAERLEEVFETDNHRFDSRRFVDACQVNPSTG